MGQDHGELWRSGSERAVAQEVQEATSKALELGLWGPDVEERAEEPVTMEGQKSIGWGLEIQRRSGGIFGGRASDTEILE